MRYLDLTLPTVPRNLALDEALLIAADERNAGSVLRLWESESFAVVLGASGRLHEDVRVEECLSDGISIARRSSGGGTVVIGPGALNVTVVLADDEAPGLGAVDVAHKFVLDRLANALRVHRPDVEVRGLGDLTSGSRKFSGSAQRRLRSHFLVHATILDRFPLPLVSRYTRQPRRQPAYREHRVHDDFLVNLDLGRDVLATAIRAAWLPPNRSPVDAEVPTDLVNGLEITKFADPAWIERL